MDRDDSQSLLRKHALWVKYLGIIMVFLTIYNTNVCAQSWPYNFYSMRNGLPSNQLFSMDEDEHGFLWIGTYLGLSRFDGKNFRDYAEEHPMLATGIKGVIARNDSLFVISAQGVAIMHNGQVDAYPFPESVKQSFVFVNKTILHKDRLYINLIHNKNIVFDLHNHVYTENSFTFASSVDTQGVRGWSVCEVQSDSLLVRVYGDKALQKYVFYVENDSIYPTSKQRIHYEDDNRRVFLDEYHKLLIDKVPVLSQTIINYEFQDSKGNIWVGTEQGLYQISSLAFEYFSGDDGMPNYVWSIVEDKQGKLWFASWGDGIASYDGQSFQTEEGLDIRMFYMGACQTREGFLQPYSGGVIEYADGQWAQLAFPSDGYVFTYNDSLENRQFFSGVKNLLVREADTLKVFAHEEHDNFLFLSIVKDKKDRYWMGNVKGVRIFKEDTFVGVEEGEIPLQQGFICSAIDHKKNLWLGGRGLIVYKYNSIDTLSFPQFSQLAFLKNYKDSLMLVGCKLGLGIIDLERYYAGEENYFRFITENEGFTGETCGQNGCFIDSKGLVWFTTTQHVNCLDIRKLNGVVHQPNVYFHTLNTASDELQWEEFSIEHFPNDSTWELNYPHNNIQISYEAIDLQHSASIQFRYILEGYSKQWSTFSQDKSVTYTNLAPGKYVFKIEAVNPYAECSSVVQSFSFFIRPLFWQMLWVKILFAILFLFVFYLLLKNYFQRKRAREVLQQEQQDELNNLQVANVNSQLNPHFIFNALNSIAYEIHHNKGNAYHYLSKMSKLIRISLQHSPKAVTTLREEVNFVEDYLKLQVFRFGDKFDYTIGQEESVDPHRNIPKMLIQILVENALIHGIEKRPEKGKLSLDIYENNELLRIVVADNGMGFDPETLKESKGTGLKNIRKILAIYNGYNEHKASLTIVSSIGEGTKAEVHIPANYIFAFIRDN